jgi:O-antigen ligase
VAAETGFPGLAVFLALVVVSLGTAFRRIRDGFDANARLAFGLALTAIFVHSVFYNALFEDPTFWGLLGLIAVAVRAEEAA